jgi:hypothetical protein
LAASPDGIKFIIIQDFKWCLLKEYWRITGQGLLEKNFGSISSEKAMYFINLL